MAVKGTGLAAAEGQRASTSPSPSYLASFDRSPFSSRHRRHASLDNSTKRPGRVYRARSASNILDSNDDFTRRLYDPLLAPHLQRSTASKDGITDLIDFLRNHAPPPDNFMSTPDGADDERRRWLRWADKVAKRAKGNRRQPPPQIILPDTAVSGTTIGGHRHIAITIPFEAFPMGESPRSQYPVYASHHDRRANSLGSSPVRTVVNDKGVVTVLKTVSEDRYEASGSAFPRRAPHYSSGQAASLPPSRAGRSSIHGFVTSPPSRASTSTPRQVDEATGWDMPRSRPSTQASMSSFPARSSSRASQAMQQHVSIDGMLSQPGTSSGVPGSSRGEDRNRADNWPPTKKKGTARPQLGPIVVNGQSSRENGGISTESGATVLNDNPLGRSRNDNSAPPTPTSPQNRRDRVRDRKRRDMDALLGGKQRLEDSDGDELVGPGPGAYSSRSCPTLSPIRVVMNVEPSMTPVEQASVPPSPREQGNEEDTPADAPADPKSHAVSGMDALFHGSNQPTPPRSPDLSTTPPRRHSTLDRTALQRRREWNATREQERKMKEARNSVHSQAKRIFQGDSGDSEIPQALDGEILRLYEAYREHRFRDMERRVRRLERNGDVWLRALVPVLDNLNRTMGSSQDGLEDRAWVSDDESSTTRRQRQQRMTGSPRQVDSSRTRAPDNNPGTPVPNELSLSEDNRRNSEGSDDVTGLDTIEPLMRELAGAARLRQIRSEGGLLEAY